MAVSTIPIHECEADVPEGLEGLAWREMKTTFGDRLERADTPARAGALRFQYAGNPYQLLKLRTLQAVYSVRYFDIPRPKALLGDEHFKALLAQIRTARDLASADAYKTLYLSAAGSDSSVMTRLKDELAAKTELAIGDENGDLLIRVRRAGDGWETLVRLSPRPLATRAWRVCNREGALNAAVGYAMAVLSQPTDEDVFLNLGCGSGTLLIERLAAGAAKSVIGYDEDPRALECALKNVEAAGYGGQIKLNQGDITDLPMADKSVDVVAADLPFGQLVGSHSSNVALYPAVLKEAARVVKPGGRGVFISHEVKLMDTLLDGSATWKIEQVVKVSLSGMHPRIWVLRRQ
ncbi:MAG: methyltransferase domain-containing protein [Anaerolineae bacterium]